jgi:hypothetical protein
MKIITTKVHGVFDYLASVLLIALPWLCGFQDNTTASAVPAVLGITTILFSIMTNYELGIFKLIGMRVHLFIDFISGLFLALSPWMLGFAADVKYPHLIVGLGELLIVLLTQTSPAHRDYSRRI